MWLSYFPRVYPDELLYSVIGRWRRHLGWPTPTETAASLFGELGRVRAIVDVPGQLGELAKRLPLELGHPTSKLIDQHTLFSYVTAFLDDERRDKVRSHMIGSNGKPHQHLGPRQDGIDVVAELRFCPTCAEQMTADFGETYWRRSHQLPSSLVCDEHEKWLIPWTPTPTRVRPAYIPAPLLDEIKTADTSVDCLGAHLLIVRLAKVGTQLLEAGGSGVAETIRAALTKANASDRNQALSLAKTYVVPAFHDRGLRLNERALSTTFAAKHTALAPIYNVIAATCLEQIRAA